MFVDWLIFSSSPLEICKHSIPIYDIQKNRRFLWTDLYQESFDKIKSLLIKELVIRMPINMVNLGWKVRKVLKQQ